MSKSSKFNLQIPIDKDFEEELRVLADEDGRPLRAYCRRVLELHVKNIKQSKDVVAPTIPNSEIATKEDVQKPQKPKVGGFR